MAKEEKKEERKDGAEKRSSKPKKHLHEMRIRHVVDHEGNHAGYVVHHTYKKKATDPDHMAEPEHPAAVHDTAEETGQHVQEQFGAQEGGQGEPDGDEAQGAAPQGGEPEPQAGM